MAELFLNPWSMAAGGALVSAPIIIHLINRIRYKRVRWAAMEFLLKAQKRMKRKLILQQLLLLLLRIMIILLLGLLVGRFLGFDMSGQENRSTAHVLVLDDTPSMADPWRGDDGVTTDAFEQAKKVAADQIAKEAADAPTAQTLDVVRLSDLATPRPFGRLNNTTIEELRTYLGGYKPGNVRVGLALGLKKAHEMLAAQEGDVGKVVHVLSDFRAVDWAEDGDAIKQAMADLTALRAKVHFVDTAHPFRKRDDRRAPLHHDNVSITELQPAKLVVARYDPLEFTLRVRNNGNSELKGVRFDIRVNGDDTKGRAVEIPLLPGNQERAVKFELTFDRLGGDETPLDRFSLVSAVLASGESGGLTSDNVRHAVVEVRERLPLLVVEGRKAVEPAKEGDAFYLRPVFQTVLGGFGWVDGSVRDLEQGDLSRYTFVILANVPTLSEAAAKNLEQYAKAGGGVAFFLGDQVKPADYNKVLYRDGAGLFPVPLAEAASPDLTPEELEIRRFRISQKKLLLRDPTRRTHPALAGLYTDERGEPVKDAEQLERVFGFIQIRKYWPVVRVGKWREDKTVHELYCMPNDQKMSEFEAPTRKVADELPVDDPEFAKYKDVLKPHRDELRRLAASSDPLYYLASRLDDLLADQRGVGDATEALLREFWANPKMADARLYATQLRDRVKFGDPFYVAKEFGRGRVTLVTTSAGEQWSDWPSERPGNASYTPIIKEMGNYLAGAGTDENRSVGPPVEFRLDATRYKPTARRAFVTHDPATAGPRGANVNAAPIVDLKDQQLVNEGDKLVLKFNEATNPGGYLFSLTAMKPVTPGSNELTEAPEYRAVTANIDAIREGDLKRVARDDVTQLAQGAELHAADDSDWTKSLRNKESDLSELVWLFLALMLLLIAEQYMATRLSFHANPDDVGHSAPSAAAAMRTGS